MQTVRDTGSLSLIALPPARALSPSELLELPWAHSCPRREGERCEGGASLHEEGSDTGVHMVPSCPAGETER